MNAEWSETTLGQVCEFSSGLWKGAKPPFTRVGVIRNTNFTSNGLLDDSDIAYLEVELRKLAKRRLQVGDIILEKSGGGPNQPVGRVALFDKTDGDFSFSNFTSALRIREPTKLDFRYLHRFLYWIYVAGKTVAIQTNSTGIRNLDLNAYKALPIAIPPIVEQRRIVSAIDDVFAEIFVAEVGAEKCRKNAEWLFESYLASEFSQSKLGICEMMSLRDVALVFGRGKSKHRPRNDPKLYGGRYPFVQTGDVRNADQTITSYSQTYNEAGLAQSQLWKKGTLCITIAANIAETAILGFDACFPDSIIGVTVDERKTSSKFLEYLLRTVKADLQAKGKGSAQDNINLATFEKQLFPFPALSIQAKIAADLDVFRLESLKLQKIYAQKLRNFTELRTSFLGSALRASL